MMSYGTLDFIFDNDSKSSDVEALSLIFVVGTYYTI
jgi:hypothetical protein